jgi:hypothetical protein
MDALNPKPDPTPTPAVEAAAPLPATTEGPRCTHCGEPVGGDRIGVSWNRRLTDDELADHVRLEEERRDRILLLADKQLPPPVFPSLPDGSNDTRTVYACGEHAIDMDAASRIHQKTCTAPNEIGRRGCDCTPEPAPKATPEPEPALALPDHWQTGA